MSTASETKAAELIIASRDGTVYYRYPDPESVPEGMELLDREKLEELDKEALEEIYAAIVGTANKSFKDHQVALDNVVYQVGKMVPVRGGPKLEPQAKQGTTARPVKPDRKYARKTASTYSLLIDAKSSEAIKSLPPQARVCVAIMAQFAKQTGRFEFSDDELKSYFESPAATEQLKTVQGPWRILQYYRSKLIGSNLLRVV